MVKVIDLDDMALPTDRHLPGTTQYRNIVDKCHHNFGILVDFGKGLRNVRCRRCGHRTVKMPVRGR